MSEVTAAPSAPRARNLIRRRLPFVGVWRQRWQVLFLMRKEFLASQRRSFLGFIWSILIPIIPITAYVVLRLFVAGQPGPDGIEPMAYVTLGVTLWMLFRDMVRTPLNAVNRYASTIANTELTVGGAILVGFGGIMIDTVLRLIICGGVIWFTGAWQATDYTGVALYLVSGTVFFFSVGVLSVPLTVVIPDLKNVYDMLFIYLIFFSLAIFPISGTDGLARLVHWNPFAAFIDAIRSLLLLGHLPPVSHVQTFAWASLAVFAVAHFLTNRAERRLKEAFL